MKIIPKYKNDLLVMVNHEDSKPKFSSIVQYGKVVWSGINGFELIGDSKEEWNDVAIFQFANATDYENEIKLLKENSFREIKMFAIAPISKTKLATIHFLMKTFLSRSKMEVLDKRRNLDSLLKSPLLPKKEQISRLLAEDDGNPVIMLNFMKFSPYAIYPANFKGKHKKNETGKRAYYRYGRHAMKAVANLGGYLDYIGTVKETLLGSDTDRWDEIALMRYPSHSTFKKMFDFKGTENAGTYRDVGLEKTTVIALKQE